MAKISASTADVPETHGTVDIFDGETGGIFHRETGDIFHRETVGIFRETVGIFEDAGGYESAITELLNQGFSWEDLRVLASNKDGGKPREGLRKWLREAEDDPAAPRTTPFPQDALGGAIGASFGVPLYIVATATAIILLALGHEVIFSASAAVAAGVLAALLGLASARAFMKPHDKDVRDALANDGGVVLWVQSRSPSQCQKAAKILLRHHASNVHMHAIQDAHMYAIQDAHIHAIQDVHINAV